MLGDFWYNLVENQFEGNKLEAILWISPFVLIIFFAAVAVSSHMTERGQKKKAYKALYNEMAAKAPGASSQVVHRMMMEERERRRAEIFDIPEVKLRIAPRPADGGHYHALRAFVQDKRANGEVLNDYEAFADGPIALVERLLGDDGFVHLDDFADGPPYKGRELREALGRISLPEFGDQLERAIGVYLHRYQLFEDFEATGMPAEQARRHPSLPSYEELDVWFSQNGGLPRLIRAADTYFEAAYPWAQ